MGYAGWNSEQVIGEKKYRCGHCGQEVNCDRGYFSGRNQFVYLCPCTRPTYFEGTVQVPGPLSGESIQHLPPDIDKLYGEVRRCMSVGSYTSAVLTCRKLLMNIAVQKGATAGQSFLQYVEWLSGNGYIPPGGKHWVDHIRTKGNEANHEIALMSQEEAERLVKFVSMLMRMVFEFPESLPKAGP